MVDTLAKTPRCVNYLLHQFWGGINRDLASELDFNFQLDSYLGDYIWCHPTPTLYSCQLFLEYILAARQLALFKEAIALVPTSINKQVLISVIEADKLLHAKQRLPDSATGYYLAYFSSQFQNRGETLTKLAEPHFWTA